MVPLAPQARRQEHPGSAQRKNGQEDRHQVEEERAEPAQEPAAVQIEQNPLQRDSGREALCVGLAIGSGEWVSASTRPRLSACLAANQHVGAAERAGGSLHDQLAFACPDRLERNRGNA